MDDNTVVDMHLARMLSLVCSSFQIPGSKASVPVDFLDSLSWVSRTLLLSILKHPLPSPFYLCRAVLGPSAHLPPPGPLSPGTAGKGQQQWSQTAATCFE